MKFLFKASYEQILHLEIEAESFAQAQAIVAEKISDGTFNDECECVDEGPLEVHDDETEQFDEGSQEWRYVNSATPSN
jgi:hypothetical protein